MESKTTQRKRRHARVRAKVKGTATRPRLSVFKSSKYIYAQIIDDEKGITIASASDHEILRPEKHRVKDAKASKIEKARLAHLSFGFL